MPVWLKYLITAAIIVLVSEVAKRSGRTGALIAALPFVTILVMTWLHIEDQGTEAIATHARYTFWYVIPTLPMFLAIPILLERGVGYWQVLGIYIAGTTLLFVATVAIGRWFGVEMIGGS